MWIVVKADWLKACGRNPENRTFEVKNVVNTAAAPGSGFETMFEVIDGDNTWTVALCRTEPEAPVSEKPAAPVTMADVLDELEYLHKKANQQADYERTRRRRETSPETVARIVAQYEHERDCLKEAIRTVQHYGLV
jgi:hypothetical protein